MSPLANLIYALVQLRPLISTPIGLYRVRFVCNKMAVPPLVKVFPPIVAPVALAGVSLTVYFLLRKLKPSLDPF